MALRCMAVAAAFVGGSDAMDQPGDAVPKFEDILKIDIHSHVFDDIPELVEMMNRVNLRIVNICVFEGQPDHLEPAEAQAEAIYQKYRPAFYFASTFDLTRRHEPAYAEEVTAWLDKTFDAGAVMTKIWKEVGMELKDPTGEYLMPDDAVFDPIYEHLVKRGKPLIAHLADPLEAWLPLDPDSVHYRYYSNYPEWHLYGKKEFPSHERILAARDNVMVKHPNLVVIGAHLGSMAHDVDEVAKLLDRFPNYYVDVSARLPNLMRQPQDKVRDFFIKYQDRIMYGVDLEPCQFPEPGEIPEEKRKQYTENLERAYRRQFAYFAGIDPNDPSQAEIKSLALPRTVLEKFYHGNAQRLMPEMAR